MKVLFIGDIYGKPGRTILLDQLDNLKSEYKPNLIVVNAENSSNNGRGITKSFYKQLMSAGVSCVTMGNHVWGNSELLEFIDDSHIVRPANFYNAPGKGYDIIRYNDKTLLVINLLGRTYMNANLENPFFMAEKIIEEHNATFSLIDFHAEATSEKVALGHYLDGKASAVVGTHTHVPTADERQLNGGTLYITDVGMTGPLDGVLGVDRKIVVERFLHGHSRPNEVAETKNQLNAVILDFEKKTIKRINVIQ
ncbi:MAG TPA: TIGR00282 family metallophosphoesterase [Acholeplasmataceae bacterium]|nr:TIGR00282 family metallophosphoesterase [Acholeplasmataceae bacterium]